MTKALKERSLVVFKPDVVQRQIVGELITKFEKKGYKIIGMKMLVPSKELVAKHYEDDKDYLTEVGAKTLAFAKERGDKTNWPDDPYYIGKQVRQWNIDYLSCGPVIAMVFEGFSVVEGIRKLIGKSNPAVADVGSIRADYTPDSYVLGDIQGRASRTMIHASDEPDRAKREVSLWFEDHELFEYETAIEKILYDTGWTSTDQ